MSSSHIYQINGGVVAVAPIVAEADLESCATAEELQSVEGITATSRRLERLAWRALLRSLEPEARVEYLPSGKPQILNSQYQHISVSHCRGAVAVVLADRGCGVDVECRSRNFERVQSRYMTQQERSLSTHEDWAAVVWCAKEALYKMAGREGVDFLSDVVIRSARCHDSKWSLTAELFGSEQVELCGECVGQEHILVFTL